MNTGTSSHAENRRGASQTDSSCSRRFSFLVPCSDYGFSLRRHRSEGSIHGFDSLHRLLESSLKHEIFQEVSRMLVGLNCGKPLEGILLPEVAASLPTKHDFDLQAFHFYADKEALRQPRIVRVGLKKTLLTAKPSDLPVNNQLISTPHKENCFGKVTYIYDTRSQAFEAKHSMAEQFPCNQWYVYH